MSLTSSSDITVVSGETMSAVISLAVLPSLAAPYGQGKLAHPILGTFEYEYKPDQWVNVDADVVIPPVWSSTKTLSGAANVLWAGNIKDVVVEERWTQAFCMSVSQLRMMMAVWTTPVDPAQGYVQWMPTYTNDNVYNVIPVELSIGGSNELVFDDVINARQQNNLPYGVIDTPPVIFKMRIVNRVN
jgi:hypothetical protein